MNLSNSLPTYIACTIACFSTLSAAFQIIPNSNHRVRTTDSRTSSSANQKIMNSKPNHLKLSSKLNIASLDDKDVGVDASVDDDVDKKRRQLLFSLLASAATTSMLPTQEAAAKAPISTLVEQEESIANAFKNAPKGPLIIPPMDTRTYETFTMPNGLKVILCSDPTSTTASVAMDVHVGAASDPEMVPGLAHFNEHMLFLGTKQFPEENSFETFLTANGGASNAFTDSENTVYYFDMTGDDARKLSEGCLRFGSFFTDPLFTETATGRELNAIESENSKNLQSDIFRLYQVEKSRSNSNHPYSKFYTGNKATLLDDTKKNNIDLRAELIKFWSTYYSADQMSVAMVAPQPLSVMKDMATKAFADIPTNTERNGMKPEEEWAGKISPFSAGTSVIPGMNHILEVVPVADVRQINLVWPIVFSSVEDKERQFLDKPAFYLGYLLGHEGPNSLLSYLKKEGWANGLGASTDADLSDFYTFEVSVQLTSKGLKNRDNVIEAIFSYIRMLSEEPIPRYIFEETLQLSELDWRFLTPGAPGQYAQSLAQNAQKYPESLMIAGPRRLALRTPDNTLMSSNKPRVQFDSQSQLDATLKGTSELVSKMNVDNTLVTVVSKSFNGKAKKQEKWYGTNYNVKPLSAASKNQWLNCRKASDLGIGYPRPNIFIPEEKGLIIKAPVKDADKANKAVTMEERLKPISPPQLIRDDGEGGRWSVYFKQDDRFGKPKACAIVQLLTKDTYSTPKKAALATLYQVSASDRLQEYAYDASLAGLSYDIQVLPRGVRLTFNGYNDKILDFVTYVTNKLSTEVTSLLPDSGEEFERYKDEIVRAFAGFDVQQPYSHAIYYTNLMLQPKEFQYTNAEMREAIATVTLDDLSQYVKKVWDSGKGEALLQGNINEKEALHFIDVIDKSLSFKTIPAAEIPPHLKALPVPIVSGELSTKVSTSEPNPSNKNAALQITFHCLDTSEKAHMIVEVLSSIVGERFYEDLRTKQQLGYIVSCGVKAVSTTRLLSFLVQSSIASCDKLQTEIQKFVFEKARPNFLEPLTDAEVNVYAKALLLKKTEPDKNLATEASRNWNEIATGRYEFDRRQREADALLRLTKEDILDYFDKYILDSGDGHRMLISEVVPQSGPSSSKAPQKSFKNGFQIGIDDIDTYRTQ